METVGWAAAVVAAVGGVTWVLTFLLDQIPALCRKAVAAVRSVKELRAELGKPPVSKQGEKASDVEQRR